MRATVSATTPTHTPAATILEITRGVDLGDAVEGRMVNYPFFLAALVASAIALSFVRLPTSNSDEAGPERELARADPVR